MSILGLSSYFLWTQKGQTVLPLVRGSGFAIAFQQLNTFYHHHIVTAAHVSCPVRYRHAYGDTVGFKAIGERHVSTRLLVPDPKTHHVGKSINLEFKQNYMPNVDVATLRCSRETDLSLSLEDVVGGQEKLTSVAPLEVDMSPIEDGTELVFAGVEVHEARANPNDDGLLLEERRLRGTCKAALVSLDYGTVLLASLNGSADVSGVNDDGRWRQQQHSEHGHPLPLSMCGGPVLRKSSGKCVGVTVARVMASAPPLPTETRKLYHDPYLDISENTSLHECGPLDVAFVPIGEFYHALRRSEM